MTPDPGSTDESFYVLTCMLVIGCVILGLLFRWYKQWKDPVERIMTRDEAKEAFGRLMSERIGIAMRSAELDAVIAEKWAEWPIEYRGPLERILREAQLMEDNMIAEAREKGIYPRHRILSNGYIAPDPPDADITTPSMTTTLAPRGENVVELHGRKWVGGQLLKVGS